MTRAPDWIPLTEAEWNRVLELRILSKRGMADQSKGARKLIDRAFKEDPKRYAAMDVDVFNAAAASIGSTARRQR